MSPAHRPSPLSLAYCFSGAGGAGLGRPLKIEKIFFSAPPFFCGRDSGGLLLVVSPGRAGEGCEAPPGRVAGAGTGLRPLDKDLLPRSFAGDARARRQLDRNDSRGRGEVLNLLVGRNLSGAL